MTTQETYEAYLLGYQKMVSETLLPKTALYDYFGSQLSDDREHWLEVEPLVFFLFQSLELDVMLTLAKLLDGKRSDRNMYRFLNYCESNRGQIRWKDANEIPNAVIKGHQQLLAGHSAVIERLKTRRDKYFVHCDREYFLQPHKLDNDYPIATSEIIDLLRCFQRILANHCMGLHGSARVSTEAWFHISAQNMLDRLYAGRSAQTNERND